MTWNSGPASDNFYAPVTAAIDEINARLGWPGHRPEPCAGHMVHEHQRIDGIDVSGGGVVDVAVAGITVGTGERWGGIGNASVRCLLPHTSQLDSPYMTGLHQGGALNAFQHHLLVTHGTHVYGCRSWWAPRDRWCRICQAA
ncbi:hypothetical protein [Streptosporangium lutulentum]|uniref:Uncharacterized protein n=1 Tax=Streptosporangium lutulentum TaxID=1461250 RepID=A0ABT9Q9B4_9ACTN|nr:hypothetical protein [Streptosporangium lutulentum]MDP9843345.1 hypothetical protein [Streptosporangium lutulentum]